MLTHKKAKKDPIIKQRIEGLKNPDSAPTKIVTTQGSIVALNRSDFAWYGIHYSDENGMDNTNYNHLFDDYAYQENDCQNFLSQALWYGFSWYFGTENNSTDINSHKNPMIDDSDSNTNDWWQDDSNTDSNWMWTGTLYFDDYVSDNYNNNKKGVAAYEGSEEYVMVGDYLYYPGHVMLVTDVIDHDGDGQTDWDEIYLSAHTNNHSNLRTTEIFNNKPNGLKYMFIYGWRL